MKKIEKNETSWWKKLTNWWNSKSDSHKSSNEQKIEVYKDIDNNSDKLIYPKEVKYIFSY